MNRAFWAMVVTFFVGCAVASLTFPSTEIGVIAAIAVMGGFIIFFNESNHNSNQSDKEEE